MRNEETNEKWSENHSKMLVECIRLMRTIELSGVHNKEVCIAGEFCKLDAMEALVAGKANQREMEIGAFALAEGFLNSNPMVPILLGIMQLKEDAEASK